MLIWLQEFGMQLLLWLLGLLDSLFAVFGAAAGTTTVTGDNGTGGEEMSLGEYFLSLGGVHKAFGIVVIASVAICGVCTIAAIIKNVVGHNGESKSHVRTVGQALSSVLVTFAMAAFLMVGVSVADGLLLEVNKAINNGEQMTMSREIINISVQDGYEYDYDNILHLNEYDENGELVSVSYLYKYADDGTGNPKFFYNPDNPELPVLLKPDGTEYSYYNEIFKVKKDDSGQPIKNKKGYTVYEIIDVNMLVKIESGTGWLNEHDKSDISADIWSVTVEDLFGTHKDGVVFPKTWNRDGMIVPDNFNFLVAYLCTVIVLIAIVGATLGLVKRLFDIVLLFIALPGIAATIPLDDGAKFKLWRETVISKVLLAFGSVFAVNVFSIVAPTLWGVSLDTNGFTNAVLRLVLICGGALTISGGQLLFARLLGTSAEESREMGQSARTLFGGATTLFGLGKAAGRGLFGYRNANGQRVGGLIKGGASVAGSVGGGAVNAVGGMIGGQAYRGSKFGRAVSKTQNALKNFGQSSGWFGKDRTTGENNLGGNIGAGIGKAFGKLAGSDAAKKTGLNNGIAGAIKTPIDKGHAAARQNARDMISQGSKSLAASHAAAEAAPLHNAAKPLQDDFGREVVAGFEGGAPSTLPAIPDNNDKH